MGSAASAMERQTAKGINRRAKANARKEESQQSMMHLFFSQCDLNHDKVLSTEEVTALMTKVAAGEVPDPEDVELVMRIGGDTADHTISEAQLPEALAIVHAVQEEKAHLKGLFAKFDADGTNALDPAELKNLLREVNQGEVSDVDCASVMKRADHSGDGLLQIPELKSAIAWWFVMEHKPDPAAEAPAPAPDAAAEAPAPAPNAAPEAPAPAP